MALRRGFFLTQEHLRAKTDVARTLFGSQALQNTQHQSLSLGRGNNKRYQYEYDANVPYLYTDDEESTKKMM